MPRNYTTQCQRVDIAAKRARLALLEAQVKAAIPDDGPPDLTGLSYEERLEGYCPTPEEHQEREALLIERLTVWGRNKGVLSEEKVRALSEAERASITQP